MIVACLLAMAALPTVASATEGGPDVAVPKAQLRLDAVIAPATVAVNVPVAVEGSITVTNDGPCTAAGVLVHEPFLTAMLADVDVIVAASDPAITWIVIGLDPLIVNVPVLPQGAQVTVRIRGQMLPECWMDDLETQAIAVALNADDVSAPMTLAIDVDGPEVCDGVDNDCDEVTDEGGAALCDDADVCTGTEICAGASGCIAQEALVCDDGDACTVDACLPAAGCVATPIDGCPACVPVAETCTDGLDTDCDALVDCGDPDCAVDAACAPEPPAEVCSDCADNDGDGLVDAEDPDCCTDTHGLIVTRLRIEPEALAPRKKIRLRTRDDGMLGTLDLAGRDVGLQFRDVDGTLFCACIAPGRWQHHRKRVMRFRDRAHTYAAGLDRGRLRLRDDGMVQLDTVGDGRPMRRPTGGTLHVMLRVGTLCLVADRDLHAHHGVFRAP